VFGTLEHRTFSRNHPIHALPNIQGGFVGYTRQAAEDIWRSGVMLDRDLIDNPKATYADVPEILERAEGGMVSTDFLVRYACRKLAIDCVGYKEVKSLYRGFVRTDRPDEFAFTHPHKEEANRHALDHVVRKWIPPQVRDGRRWLQQAIRDFRQPRLKAQPAGQAA
jgi:hypothetical protein